MYRYHKNVGFPTNLHKPKGAVTLQYSEHALRAATQNDRYGRNENPPIAWLPKRVRLERMELVECDADAEGNVYKAVYRVGYKPEMGLMLVLVILFYAYGDWQAEPLVKSVWMNPRQDRHRNLDTSKYDRPGR